MKVNILKTIVTLAISIPCLVGCESFKEGELVAAECIFNAYEELPDYSSPFTLEVEDYKDLEVQAHGDYFYINDFKIYDSLYLADVNGDGHRDFCTDFRYTTNGHNYHGYAFYNMKKGKYIEKYFPENKASYYLGAKDGALIVKEFYSEHNPDNYKEGLYHRRTATLLTSKEKPTYVWKDEEFKAIGLASSINYRDEHGVHSLLFDGGNSGIEESYGCETGRVFSIACVYAFNGVIKEEDYNIVSFNNSSAYKIEFDNETTSILNNHESQRAYAYYKITFFEEGKFNIDVKIQDMEVTLPVTVDNARFNRNSV